MLSKEDIRRLAQLERRLRREDPEFYDLMSAESRHRRPRAPFLIIAATVIWLAAVVLGLIGRWIPATIIALCATVVLAALTHRLLHAGSAPGEPPPR